MQKHKFMPWTAVDGKTYEGCIYLEDEVQCLRFEDNDIHKLEQKSAFSKQVGGNHYKDMAVQPIEFIVKNKIPFLEGNVIKYVVRWSLKNGLEDLKKARHYLDLLIEMEENRVNET